ncbi:MAG: C45 family autoproteolytic acyltransferase/hydrolase [Pirellulaceae bacterium]
MRICLVHLALFVSAGWAQQAAPDPLADGLRSFWQGVAGAQPFRLQGQIEMPASGQMQRVDVDLVRFNEAAFDLTVTHADYAIRLRRRGEATALALPKHGVVFRGSGDVDPVDHLAPKGIMARLISPRTVVAAYLPLVLQADPQAVSALARGVLQAQYDPEAQQWTIGDRVVFSFPGPGSLALAINEASIRLQVTADVAAPEAVDAWPDMRVVELERNELERQLARGVRRALEILAPSSALTNPSLKPRHVAHGELRWIDGQRVVLLQGTPEEVGRAHGELLHDEAVACIDSVLNAFGTVQTIARGRWFRHELMDAYARLKPHIPERHLAETRALAHVLDLDETVIEAVNVFPEMFHCSGFALFGKATRDGKLYHGRVLDYMTAIGLQDAATTFIVSVNGQIPFANVGYAGFIGSVSGMNAQAISLGEMGGGGEGQWDGVPMATLMRRALEECDTLEEVMELWRIGPRTCEYYFVFADGKSKRAVGVAAVPESVEFILPGQTHARLGEGIEDAVVLSAGKRLETLRERVQSHYGRFDVELGQWLMSRPVAMESNLHNVLFVPEEGVLYVANADHQHCAADRPYARIDLRELLTELPGRPAETSLPSTADSRD